MFKGQSNEPLREIKDPETIIGPSMSVSGDFKGNGDVIVDGKVKGTLKTKKDIHVGEEAVISADIVAENALIAGSVTGKIVVKSKLEITSSANINGDVTAQSIDMEAGATINGTITMENPSKSKNEESDSATEKKKND